MGVAERKEQGGKGEGKIIEEKESLLGSALLVDLLDALRDLIVGEASIKIRWRARLCELL